MVSLMSRTVPAGVLAACAIGSELTQSTLDSFHTAGIKNELVSTGMTRLNECVNNSNTLPVILITLKTSIDIVPAKYLKTFLSKEIQIVSIDNDNIVVGVYISFAKMLEHSVPVFDIVNKFKNNIVHIGNFVPTYDKTDCDLFFSLKYPIDIEGIKEILLDELILLSKKPREELEYTNTKFKDNDTIVQYYFYKTQSIIISNTLVYGVENVLEVVRGEGESLILVCTPQTSLLQFIPFDQKTINTNKIQDMVDIFGIEVGRRCLLKELAKTMNNNIDNSSHVKVIVDRMTMNGRIQSISRYSTRDDPDTLKRCSFEEVTRNLLYALSFGEIDLLQSQSSKIITSKLVFGQ